MWSIKESVQDWPSLEQITDEQEVDEALMSQMSTEEEEAVQAELERLQQESLVRRGFTIRGGLQMLMTSPPCQFRKFRSSCLQYRSRSQLPKSRSEKVRNCVRCLAS